mmetsp:Transcript_10193/g.18643  ORF Transcript_10193/g.18643 Transcript_10193/m.18643 type:complete len:205 (+) Transcript_10193:756-1370(+)
MGSRDGRHRFRRQVLLASSSALPRRAWRRTWTTRLCSLPVPYSLPASGLTWHQMAAAELASLEVLLPTWESILTRKPAGLLRRSWVKMVASSMWRRLTWMWHGPVPMLAPSTSSALRDCSWTWPRLARSSTWTWLAPVEATAVDQRTRLWTSLQPLISPERLPVHQPVICLGIRRPASLLLLLFPTLTSIGALQPWGLDLLLAS